MKKSEKSQLIYSAFVEALEEQGVSVKSMEALSEKLNVPVAKEMFHRWGTAGRAVLFIGGVGFVNVHVRADTIGFWGITKTIYEDFKYIERELGLSCWYVLLVERKDGRGANGYILRDLDTPPIIKRPSQTATQYKINEGSNLDREKIVRSLPKVAEALLLQGKEEDSSKK